VFNLLLLLGLVCSTIINSVVKNYVQEPRPVGSTKSGFGFPSDHAQFMSFFAVYLTLWIFSERVHFNQFLLTARTTQIDGTDILTTIYIAPRQSEADLIENHCNVALVASVVWKTLITVFIVACAVIVMWSRVSLGVHSDRQVYAGAMLGTGLGIIWHILARFIAWPIIFPWIERSAIGRMMYLRDCGTIPHILRFEWMNVQSFKQGVREKRKLT